MLRFDKIINILQVYDHTLTLFDTWVDLGINFLRTKCKENISSVDINIVTSLCFCYQALLQPTRGINLAVEFTDVVQATLNRVFAFSFIWSVGGNINHTSTEKFDHFFRTDLETLAAFPGADTVFEYFVNIKDQVNLLLSIKYIHIPEHSNSQTTDKVLKIFV